MKVSHNSHHLLQVAAFYSFCSFDERVADSLPEDLISLASRSSVRGSVLIALEGINGTICGPQEGIATILRKIEEIVYPANIDIKYSWTKKQAFRRFKSRRKKEIVTMGVKGVDPSNLSGDYVEPKDWNSILDDPKTLVIDTRNEYEISVGTFSGSINPHTNSFRDFPLWVDNYLKSFVNEKKIDNIAMFCTGGIRCEKATSYLKQEGFSNVHHLHGGILKYLEEIPEEESRWDGECFVFDQRVSLNHHLSPGVHKLCFACGMPLSPKDRNKQEYVPGIQCHYCINQFTDEDRDRFAERQKHIYELSERFPNNDYWPSS